MGGSPTRAPLLLAFCIASSWSTATAAGRVEADIPYVAGGGPKQQLDLWVPEAKGFPTILFVHGGSLTTGDRKEAPHPGLGAAFQAAGVGFAAMSYRLFPEPWPAQPRDVAAAFAWVKQNIAARGGDPQRVFLVGHSSGARLAGLVCADPKYLQEAGLGLRDAAGSVHMGAIFHDLEFEAGLKRASAERVRKLFASDPDYIPFGNQETYLDSWALPHANPRMPPFLIFVAESERMQPPCLPTAEEFAAAARRCGTRAEIEILKDRTHMSTLEKMISPEDPNLRRIVRFVSAPRPAGE